jgi:hypothetical protein
MATPLSSGRRYASPGKGGRPRYYLDTERLRFYTVPSRRYPRSRRLDLDELMTRQGTRTDFRVRANGDVYFRGVKVGYNVKDRTPQRLRSRERRELPTTPPKTPPYYEHVASINPEYQLILLKEVSGVVIGTYRNPRSGRTFTIKT